VLRAVIEFCVARRLPTLAVTLAIAAWGVYAYLATPVEAFPDVTNVQVQVIAQLPGLAPEEIERQVTIPLERALNGTPGMILLRSESLFGLSLVTLVFDDDADNFRSRMVVGQRMAEADLPPGVDMSLAPDDTPLGEVYQFRVVSDRHTQFETRSELQWTVSRVLRQVPGVADVVCFGGYLPEVHVEVAPSRLIAHDLTLAEVTEALEKSNRNVGGGFLRHGDQELTIRGIGYLQDPRELREIVLRTDHGTPVTVGDVARIVWSHVPRRGTVGWGVEREVAEGFVLMRRGENPSRVLEGVHAKVNELNAGILPRGMRIEPFYDRTTLVGLTLTTVRHNLCEGALLVAAVVWLFLRSVTCSAIVASVIPLALLTAFIGLRAIGLPANLISMGAIDFGILVDGAVVLVESVLGAAAARRPGRPREMHKLIAESAVAVARPTFFAMAIIIAALIPVYTLQRVEGRIFRPLSLTYTFALVGALVFALTAVPAMCAALLRPRHAEAHEPRLLGRLRAGYGDWVERLLSRRRWVLGGAVALVVVAAGVGLHLGAEFLPELDEGDFVIFVEMPASVSLDKGNEILTEVRRRIVAFPEVREVLSEQGRPEDGTDNELPNMSETFVRLKLHDQWRRGVTTDGLIEEIRASLTRIPGVSYNFSQPIRDNVEEAVSGVRGKIVLKIFGTDFEVMKRKLEEAVVALRGVPGVTDLGLYRDATVPQLQIRLDRAALARAGISVTDAQDVVETALGGRVTTEIWQNERPVPVRAILPESERDNESHIGDLLLPAAGGAHVPLREVARIEEALGRADIYRESNSRYAALKFNFEGRDMGSVVRDGMAAVARRVRLPEGNYFVWGGEFENQQRAMRRLAVIVPLAGFAVFALLYAALGSARSASAVLLIAPFAMTGGVFALRAWGIPLSVSAAVGFIALLGQVTLAALLVVSAIDALRREGSEMIPAILEGCRGRMRAVLMTALLAMLGLMPMAFSHGVGSETQKPFAVVIIGGLVTAVPLVLLVLPVVYSWIVRRLPAPVEEP
jgi:heavy metal efflux system protein